MFVLKNGGRVQGKLANPKQSPRKTFVVVTPSGGRITLAASAVKNIQRKTVGQKRHEERLLEMDDSSDEHWEMAQWCLKHDLTSERKFHLKRVVELDSEHAEARRALGYTQIDGRWILRREWMKEQGYVYHNGSWRTEQEREMQIQHREAELAEKGFQRKMKTWRGWIGGRNDQDAREHLRTVKDRRAAPALADLLKNESDAELKRLYIETLGRLGGTHAVTALVENALDEKSAETRDRCLDELVQLRSHAAVNAFIKALQHKNNAIINRAGIALERMNDPSAILPLINTLETQHRFAIRTGGGGINPTFTEGGGGLSVGNTGPKFVKRTFQNEAVLRALVTLTGENFNFNRQRWLDWHAEKEAPQALNLRRDP